MLIFYANRAGFRPCNLCILPGLLTWVPTWIARTLCCDCNLASFCQLSPRVFGEMEGKRKNFTVTIHWAAERRFRTATQTSLSPYVIFHWQILSQTKNWLFLGQQSYTTVRLTALYNSDGRDGEIHTVQCITIRVHFMLLHFCSVPKCNSKQGSYSDLQ